LSLESKKQSERLQKIDPSKAQQVERLGMGIMAANTGPRYLSIFGVILWKTIRLI
jgi:hypothetical protein